MTLKRMTLRKMTPQNNIQQSVVQPVTLGNAESKPYHLLRLSVILKKVFLLYVMVPLLHKAHLHVRFQ
jgi:hypothetical protein